MTTAVIYTDGSQECERIAQLLRAVPEVSEFLEYKLDKHFTKTEFEMEFGGDATYPQVSIGKQHVGNMKETLQYLNSRGIF